MSLDTRVLGRAQQSALTRLAGSGVLSPFYLAGGTAVALHLGHRRSLDLDWFTPEPLGDPLNLAQTLREAGVAFRTLGVDRGTLHGAISRVPVSLFEYRYPLLQPPVFWQPYGCSIASLDDLACMKLAAAAQRGSKKDFVDIYALGLRHVPLARMLELYRQKFATEDIGHVLFGLAYFDDAERERLPWMFWDTSWPTVKATVRAWVREIAAPLDE